jgi:hypothetical protein
MPDAKIASATIIAMLVAGAAALASCNEHQPTNRADNQDIAIDDNLGQTAGQLPANADIETLPQDESSATPSNQLQTGYDNPDVNDLGNSH